MIDDSGDIIVYQSTTKLILIVIGSVAFVLSGVFLLYVGSSGQEGAGNAAIGIMAILFFGVCALYGVFRLLIRRPALVIDAQGITDSGSIIGVGFIGWEEIAEIGEYQFHGQTMLGVLPRDVDSVLARVGFLKRIAIRANIWLGAAPISISQVTLPVPVRDLVEEIGARYDIPSQMDA